MPSFEIEIWKLSEKNAEICFKSLFKLCRFAYMEMLGLRMFDATVSYHWHNPHSQISRFVVEIREFLIYAEMLGNIQSETEWNEMKFRIYFWTKLTPASSVSIFMR